MDEVPTKELNRGLGGLLERVARGESLALTRWGKVVAWLVPPGTGYKEVGRRSVAAEPARRKSTVNRGDPPVGAGGPAKAPESAEESRARSRREQETRDRLLRRK